MNNAMKYSYYLDHPELKPPEESWKKFWLMEAIQCSPVIIYFLLVLFGVIKL
jgi:hypothetical protein